MELISASPLKPIAGLPGIDEPSQRSPGRLQMIGRSRKRSPGKSPMGLPEISLVFLLLTNYMQ